LEENKNGDDEATKAEEKESSSFFSFLTRSKGDKSSSSTRELGGEKGGTTSPPPPTTVMTVEKAAPAAENVVLTPELRAAKLRADAEKARLEADRMDAELTLRKISKLERELGAAARSDSKKNDPAAVEQLQLELERLLRKVNNESADSDGVAAARVSASGTTTKEEAVNAGPLWPKYVDLAENEELQMAIESFLKLPKFMQLSTAAAIGISIPTEADGFFNSTEAAILLERQIRCDFSGSRRPPPPPFTRQQIAAKAQRLRENRAELVQWNETNKDKKDVYALASSIQDSENPEMVFLNGVYANQDRFADILTNDEQLARLLLEYEYYYDAANVVAGIALENDVRNLMVQEAPDWSKDWLRGIFNSTDVEQSPLDATIEYFYPKCTTQADKAIQNVPTEQHINTLITDILPKVSFQTTSKPQKVLGGYALSGRLSSSNMTSDEFIEKVDAALAESPNLKGTMTVLYARDWTSLVESPSYMDDINEFGLTLQSSGSMLYIVGPEICRESRPVQLSIVSAIGLATTWYLSLYPFLLNSAIATRVDGELALVDAGMAPDLSWLTDLSLPLFASFLGIQLMHEFAHFTVARLYGVRVGATPMIACIGSEFSFLSHDDPLTCSYYFSLAWFSISSRPAPQPLSRPF
jgi:hypothetical protein